MKKKVTFANREISNNVTERQPTLIEYIMQKERTAKKSNPFKTMRETIPVYESVNTFNDTFEQDNHQKNSDLHQVQATDELETIKFLKTFSKNERENLGFLLSSKITRRLRLVEKITIHLIVTKYIMVKSVLAQKD